MIKQALLFVVSTGVLIYFIMPVDDDKQSQPTVQQESMSKPAASSDLSDSWGDDSDDVDDEEEFVFGEPVIYSEDDEEDDYQLEAPVSPAVTDQRRNTSRATRSSSPKSGRLGSKENPIDLTPPGGRRKS